MSKLPPGTFKRVYKRVTCSLTDGENMELKYVATYHSSGGHTFPDFIVPNRTNILCYSCDSNKITFYDTTTQQEIGQRTTEKNVVRLAWNDPHNLLLACAGNIWIFDLYDPSVQRIIEIGARPYGHEIVPLDITELTCLSSRHSAVFAATVCDLIVLLTDGEILMFKLSGEALGPIELPPNHVPSETIALHRDSDTGFIYLAGHSNHGAMVFILQSGGVPVVSSYHSCPTGVFTYIGIVPGGQRRRTMCWGTGPRLYSRSQGLGGVQQYDPVTRQLLTKFKRPGKMEHFIVRWRLNNNNQIRGTLLPPLTFAANIILQEADMSLHCIAVTYDSIFVGGSRNSTVYQYRFCCKEPDRNLVAL